ncbi:hypothetical protein [Dermabacter hominis]|uniref:hypothetical protein n=1 Tax=Dermabacter hominis TaxID=36740 RepID=UPI0007734B12|nr:hypothetical protein [Dermabacter hominis]
MSERESDGSLSREAVTFHIHLYWASWAAPSLPAPLTARELRDLDLPSVSVDIHDVSVAGEPEQVSAQFFPRVLPTWRIVALRGSEVVGERVVEGACPKFAVRDALDDLWRATVC